MNRSLIIYDVDNNQVAYLSERLGSFPGNLKDYLKQFPKDYSFVVKEGKKEIQKSSIKDFLKVANNGK